MENARAATAPPTLTTAVPPPGGFDDAVRNQPSTATLDAVGTTRNCRTNPCHIACQTLSAARSSPQTNTTLQRSVMAGKLNVGARHAGLQRPAPAGLYTTDRTLRRSRSARPVAPPSRGAARLHFCSPEGRIQRNRPACAIVNETPGGVHGEVELGAEEALLLAIERRASAGLFQRAAREGTTAFRLLHGPTEGAPGVSVDLYGTRVLVQSWREPLGVDACDALGEACRGAMRPFVEGPLEVEFHLRGRAARQAGRPLHQPVKRVDDAAEQVRRRGCWALLDIEAHSLCPICAFSIHTHIYTYVPFVRSF